MNDAFLYIYLAQPFCDLSRELESLIEMQRFLMEVKGALLMQVSTNDKVIFEMFQYLVIHLFGILLELTNNFIKNRERDIWYSVLNIHCFTVW